MTIPSEMLAAAGMGQPRQYFTCDRARQRRWRMAGFILLAAGLALLIFAVLRGWLIWRTIGPVRLFDWVPLPVVMAGALIVSGSVALIAAWSDPRTAVMLFSAGLRVRQRGRISDWPWQDIAQFRISRRQSRPLVRRGTTEITIELVNQQGRRLRLGAGLAGIELLAEVIPQEVGERLLERLRQQYLSGEACDFGVVRLHPQRGLGIQQQWLAWAQVAGLRLADGYLLIYLSGQNTSPSRLPAAQIANLNVFLALASAHTRVDIPA